jgi:hypothetical protein
MSCGRFRFRIEQASPANAKIAGRTVIYLTERSLGIPQALAYQREGDAAMFTTTDDSTNDRSDVTDIQAPVELTPEQIDGVSGGCLYGPGIYGPTLILPVLVAILIG